MSARAFSQSALASVVVLLIGTATGVLSARTLGPVDRGYLGILVFWPGFITAFSRLPYGDATVFHYSDAVTSTRGKRRDVFETALKFCLVAMAIGIIPSGIGLWASVHRLPGGVSILAIEFGAVYFVMSHLTEVYLGILRARGRFSLVNVVRLTVPLSYFAGVVVSFAFGATLGGFVLANCVSMALGLAAAIGGSAGERHAASRLTASDPFIRTLAAFHGLSLVLMLSTQVDRLLLIPTSTPQQVGIYVIAVTMAAPVQGFVGTSVATVGLPAMLAMEEARRGQAAVRMLRLVLTASLAGAVIVAVLAPFVAPLLFGARFLEAGKLAPGVAFAGCLVAVRQAFAPVFKSRAATAVIVIGELIYLGAFCASFGAAWLAKLHWPVIYGIAAGNLASTMYLALKFHRAWPGLRLRSWAVPTPAAALELMSISFAGVALRFR